MPSYRMCQVRLARDLLNTAMRDGHVDALCRIHVGTTQRAALRLLQPVEAGVAETEVSTREDACVGCLLTTDDTPSEQKFDVVSVRAWKYEGDHSIAV